MGSDKKGSSGSHFRPERPRAQTTKLSSQTLSISHGAEDKLAKQQTMIADIQRIRSTMQRELAIARQIRAEAERYRRETETKARSQAQTLILQARLATKKQIAALKRTIDEDIQKALADIRMIRITAQEELGAQRKFTDAAKIRALSLAAQQEAGEMSESEEEAIGV